MRKKNQQCQAKLASAAKHSTGARQLRLSELDSARGGGINDGTLPLSLMSWTVGNG